ncbi:MAG TPA: hypothetical protein VGH20_01430 [Myxococcales bacterium]
MPFTVKTSDGEVAGTVEGEMLATVGTGFAGLLVVVVVAGAEFDPHAAESINAAIAGPRAIPKTFVMYSPQFNVNDRFYHHCPDSTWS